MCVVNEAVLPVILHQEHIGKCVLDPFHTNGIRLVRNTLEAWSNSVEVGKENWE